jgi:alkanesulfonate monooxygenase SsuD/methylene tetrahydromethanopterin reductase-like flavin-dependent oxidoreductase (luciferase family)
VPVSRPRAPESGAKGAASRNGGGLKVGLGLFTAQVPPGSGRTVGQEYADILALCRLAEEAGFDSVWLSEHHGAADSYLPSLPVLGAAIAAVTSRIEIGFGVVLGPFQHPIRFAEDCAVLDQLAGGRLIPGLAPGWREEEFRAFGVPIAERVGRNSELVRICKLAWTEKRFSFDGRYFHFDQVAVTPKPAHPLELILGGFVEKAAARAGRLGDGFLASRPSLDKWRSLVAAFDGGVRESGRDPKQLTIGFLQNSWLSQDGQAPDHVWRGAWHQLGTYQAWEATDTPEQPYQLPPLDRESVARRMAMGTPEQVVENLKPMLEAHRGRKQHAVFRLHYPGMTRDQAAPAVELFAQRVIPELKRLAG